MRLRNAVFIMFAALYACAAGFDKPSPDWVEKAYGYLEQNRDRLGLDSPRAQLQVTRTDRDAAGYTHVRFRHVVGEVPVWSEELIVHFDTTGIVYRTDGRITPGLSNLDTTPRLTAQEAIRIAKGDFNGTIQADVELVVLVQPPARLVYEVTVRQGFRRDMVFVDAQDGRVLKVLSGTMQ